MSFQKTPPCGAILVSDHYIFIFWVVADERFNMYRSLEEK